MQNDSTLLICALWMTWVLCDNSPSSSSRKSLKLLRGRDQLIFLILYHAQCYGKHGDVCPNLQGLWAMKGKIIKTIKDEEIRQCQQKTGTNRLETNSLTVWHLILLTSLKRKENESSGLHWEWWGQWKVLCGTLSNLHSAKIYWSLFGAPVCCENNSFCHAQ